MPSTKYLQGNVAVAARTPHLDLFLAGYPTRKEAFRRVHRRTSIQAAETPTGPLKIGLASARKPTARFNVRRISNGH
jgi:hypothetical protein